MLSTLQLCSAALAIGTAPYLVLKGIEYLPEHGDSFKHKLRHKFGMAGGSLTYYTSVFGHKETGLRCWMCGKISDGPEQPGSGEDPADKASRLYHKYWYERWGPKDHNSYTKWLDQQRMWRKEEEKLKREADVMLKLDIERGSRTQMKKKANEGDEK
jgi:hypothetical protein